MTPISDETFSQNKRRLKIRFIGTVGTTVNVIRAKSLEHLPRGLSEISHPRLLDLRPVVANSMLAELGNSRLTVRRDSFVSTAKTIILNGRCCQLLTPCKQSLGFAKGVYGFIGVTSILPRDQSI